MKTLAEKIMVMQAAARGEIIEAYCIRRPDSKWLLPLDGPTWNWPNFDYRVKPPRPQEYWLVFFTYGEEPGVCEGVEDVKAFDPQVIDKVVHVIEVVEDDECTMGRTEIPPEDKIPPICPRCQKETSDPHPDDDLCPRCELEWTK